MNRIEDETVDLVYIDPPFNTGKVQSRKKTETIRSDSDEGQVGFAGHTYLTRDLGEVLSYEDSFRDLYLSFLRARLLHIHRVLKPTGTFYLHLDYREVHYARFLGDQIFGRENFMNEIIWAYDYGGKPKTRWPAKHDNILVWAKKLGDHLFNVDDIDREPYMAPGMVTEEKAARGKLPTDVWWHTIVSPTGREKTGYPTQKPLGVVERIVRASSPPGGLVLDCFAGSGTVGEACLRLGRHFVLMDRNLDAFNVMKKRFAPYRESGHAVAYLKSRKRTDEPWLEES